MSIFKKIIGSIPLKKTKKGRNDVEYLDDDEWGDEEDVESEQDRDDSYAVASFDEEESKDDGFNLEEHEDEEDEVDNVRDTFIHTSTDMNEEDGADVKINYRNDLLNSSRRNKEDMYEDIRKKATNDELIILDGLMKGSLTHFELYQKVEEYNISLMLLVALGFITEEDLVGYRAYQKRGLDKNDYMTEEEMTQPTNQSYADEVLNNGVNLHIIEDRKVQNEEIVVEQYREDIEQVSAGGTVEEVNEQHENDQADEEVNIEEKSDGLWDNIKGYESKTDKETISEREEDTEKVGEKTDKVDAEIEDATGDKPPDDEGDVIHGKVEQEITKEGRTEEESSIKYDENKRVDLSELRKMLNIKKKDQEKENKNSVDIEEEKETKNEEDLVPEVVEEVKGQEPVTGKKTVKNLEDVLKGYDDSEESTVDKSKVDRDWVKKEKIRNVYVICEGVEVPEIDGYRVYQVDDIDGVHRYSASKDNLLVVTSKLPKELLKDMGLWLQGIVEDGDVRRMVTMEEYEVDHPNIEKVIKLTKEDLDAYYDEFTNDKYINKKAGIFLDIQKLFQ